MVPGLERTSHTCAHWCWDRVQLCCDGDQNIGVGTRCSCVGIGQGKGGVPARCPSGTAFSCE
eukprot:355871-Chlamydomonas_euryale.AAC.11